MDKKVTKSEWRRLCIQLGRWCPWEDVKDCTYDEAVAYIKSMPTWEGM